MIILVNVNEKKKGPGCGKLSNSARGILIVQKFEKWFGNI